MATPGGKESSLPTPADVFEHILDHKNGNGIAEMNGLGGYYEGLFGRRTRWGEPGEFILASNREALLNHNKNPGGALKKAA